MKIRRKQRQKRTHAFSWGIIVVLLSLFFLGIFSVRGVNHVIEEWTRDLPSVYDSEAFAYSEKTRIYASDQSTLLAEFYLQDQQPVELDEVCDYVVKGTVATEDARFYEHDGVDFYGIARALVNNLNGGTLEGASTITQQLVRNTLLSKEANEISLKRKVREAQLALNMESAYSKDEILLMYLNTINYGDGCYGIEAAAQHYFQKAAADLSITEAATLIGIPQSPTYNNPVTYPDNCLKRRNLVLDRMLTSNIITAEEHEAARAEDLNLDVAPARSADGIYEYPYFTSYVRSELLSMLSYEEVFDGGLTVYTTIDPTLQEYAEEAADVARAEIDGSGNSDVELSLTCVDPATGHVLAMIGGEDYDENEFNLATDAKRQAGSSFKTFTLAACIEQGTNPLSKINCSKSYEYNGWQVSNSTGSDYGTRTIEEATWLSSNTGYARLVTEDDGVTPASVVDMAKRMGVTGSESEGYGAYPAITLGVAQTNTLTMAGAYATFAANGIYHKVSPIAQIVDKDGNISYDNNTPAGEQVITHEVAYATTRVLEGVLTEGTAKGYSLSSGQVAAGKTGTSENTRDLWFCGYTPQYSCAVWTGADPEREMTSAAWSRIAWKTFMDKALEGQEKKDFDAVDDPPYESELSKKSKTTTEDMAKTLISQLSGKTLDEVKSALALKKVNYVEQYSNSVPAASVISIEFNNGEYSVYVSKGPDPATSSGNSATGTNANGTTGASGTSVVGMSENAALSALTEAGFSYADVQYAASSTVAKGIVISQSHTSPSQGTTVTIVISTGPE